MIASCAAVSHSLFTFDHSAFTAKNLITEIAAINRINIISVALITIIAAFCIAIFARMESITVLFTAFAPDFYLTAIVATSSFGDAVQASILVTSSTLFHIHAVHTEPFVTTIAAPLPTTMQTVTPVADAT